jgi:hypothetical protein
MTAVTTDSEGGIPSRDILILSHLVGDRDEEHCDKRQCLHFLSEVEESNISDAARGIITNKLKLMKLILFITSTG